MACAGQLRQPTCQADEELVVLASARSCVPLLPRRVDVTDAEKSGGGSYSFTPSTGAPVLPLSLVLPRFVPHLQSLNHFKEHSYRTDLEFAMVDTRKINVVHACCSLHKIDLVLLITQH